MLVNGNLVVGIPLFCRISEFGSINIREFATRIVAKRQNVIVKADVFFSGGNSCVPSVAANNVRARKFGRTLGYGC